MSLLGFFNNNPKNDFVKTKKINRPTRGKTKCRDCGTNLAFGIIGGGTTGSEKKRGVGHGVEHFQ